MQAGRPALKLAWGPSGRCDTRRCRAMGKHSRTHTIPCDKHKRKTRALKSRSISATLAPRALKFVFTYRSKGGRACEWGSRWHQHMRPHRPPL